MIYINDNNSQHLPWEDKMKASNAPPNPGRGRSRWRWRALKASASASKLSWDGPRGRCGALPSSTPQSRWEKRSPSNLRQPHFTPIKKTIIQLKIRTEERRKGSKELGFTGGFCCFLLWRREGAGEERGLEGVAVTSFISTSWVILLCKKIRKIGKKS